MTTYVLSANHLILTELAKCWAGACCPKYFLLTDLCTTAVAVVGCQFYLYSDRWDGKSSADAKHSPNVVLLLGKRLRRWPNSKPTLGERFVFAGRSVRLG